MQYAIARIIASNSTTPVIPCETNDLAPLKTKPIPFPTIVNPNTTTVFAICFASNTVDSTPFEAKPTATL